MTTLALPRLYLGWWPLLRAFGVVCTAIGLALFASMARSAFWPVAPGAAASAWLSGSITYLLAGIVAGLLASGAWELRASSFAWNTPTLGRRVRREIAVGGQLVLVVGAGVGAALHGPLTGASWLLVVAAALGFTVGLVNSLSRLMWARFGGTLGLVLAMLPLFLMPEIANLTASWGFLWALLAAGAMVLATARLGDVLARPDDGAAVAGGSDGRGLDARLLGTASPLRRAPRDGSDGFRGMRSSDLDWTRALLHESHGVVRGGLIGSAIRFGLATVLVTCLVRGFFRSIGSLRAVDSATGAEPTPETVHFTGVQQGLRDFSVEWLLQPFASAKEELIAVNLVAVLLGAVIWNRAASSSLSHQPISRRRLAKVVWLGTQLEDLAAAAGVLGGFVALGWAAAHFTGTRAWDSVAPFVTTTAAVFTLVPLVRWVRLWLVEARRPARRRDAASELQDPWIQCCYALAMGALVGAAILLTRSWHASSAWLRAATPAALHGWVALVALVPIALVRRLWLAELRRYYRSNDLA
ncbi:MAG: hypothetical protein JNK49_06450 [Planctomycetes bacterium]|nr:hypothetical protein [Planctomycetota bacterium]